jgi:hypothetical protein
MPSGERFARKSSMPISAGMCIEQPGSVKRRFHIPRVHNFR